MLYSSPEFGDVVAVEEARNRTLAMQMCVDRDREDAAGCQVAAPRLTRFLVTPKIVQYKTDRKRTIGRGVKRDRRYGFVRITSRQAQPLTHKPAGQVRAFQHLDLRRFRGASHHTEQ